MKTILITGATDGLGKAVALDLAKKNHRILIHGRNPEKGAKIIDEIIKATGNKNIKYYNADFADIEEIKELANQIMNEEEHLDALVNNAGLGIEANKRISKQGHEMLFQVNYLGTYIMTKLLTPMLSESNGARIVNIASAGQAAIDFDDPMQNNGWSGYQAYCQSKLGQIALTFELADELRAKGITINALHPASMMPTKIVQSVIDTLEDGVKSVVRLVEDKSLEEITGKYYFKRTMEKAHLQAYDSDARKQLIKLSKDLTQI